jgi:KDO2-lipid IV(A) lauroyltransferase
MQGDRDVSGTGKALPFFGRSASFPVGPFRLAALAGVPLLPVFVLQGDGRYSPRRGDPPEFGAGERLTMPPFTPR